MLYLRTFLNIEGLTPPRSFLLLLLTIILNNGLFKGLQCFFFNPIQQLILSISQVPFFIIVVILHAFCIVKGMHFVRFELCPERPTFFGADIITR